MLARIESARARGAGPKAAKPGPAPVKLPGRTPPHPGQFLESRFLKPLAISQTELAAALGVSRRRVNELVNGRRGVSPSTALRLSKFLGTSAEFWLNLQLRWDLYAAQRDEAEDLRRIRQVKPRSAA